MKTNRLEITKSFSKIIIGFFLASLIFPLNILAEDPKSLLLPGLFTNSNNTHQAEILNNVANSFDANIVWTHDQTDFILGILGALATKMNIPTSTNGLQDPLLSEISRYWKDVTVHSAGALSAIALAKQGLLWGDTLYLVSTAVTSQTDLTHIRALTSQGKGFNKIVLYTGDDMIPNFKELNMNFRDNSIKLRITENSEIPGIKLMYEDRGMSVDLLEFFLSDFATKAKAQLGKEPISVTIYGDVPGNGIKIEWEGGAEEDFNLQKDALTGNDFQNEDGIFVIPLYGGFPHGLSQLVVLAAFKDKYGRYPGIEDLVLFKQLIEEYRNKSKASIIPARDPNRLSVVPEGNVLLGQILTYKVEYENEGEGIAYGVYFTDTLEQDLDETTLTIGPVLDAATGQQIGAPGIYDSQTRTITWFAGEVGSKQGGSATFSVKVKDTILDGSEIINFATVYFPSVPEETRTNGVVNIVKTFSDNVPPETLVLVSPAPNSAGWNNQDLSVSLTASDNSDGAGVEEIRYKLTGAVNDEKVISGNSTQIYISAEGLTNLTYYSLDNENNIEIEKLLQIKLDKTLPVICVQTLPLPNSFGWHNQDVAVTFNATDGLSGIASVTPPQTIATEGANQIIGGEAIDLADNRATTSVALNIDKTNPQISLTSPGEGQEYFHNQAIPLTYTTTDNLSQIAYLSVSLDGTILPASTTTIQPKAGIHSLIITATDKAGNQKILERHFTVKLKAELTIKPEAFLMNRGIFIALVKFPQGYDVKTITDATCDGAPNKLITFLPHNKAVILFRKEDITQLPLDTIFVLRGHFNNGLLFEGKDTIKKVIKKDWLHKSSFKQMKDDQNRELKPYKTMGNFS